MEWLLLKGEVHDKEQRKNHEGKICDKTAGAVSSVLALESL